MAAFFIVVLGSAPLESRADNFGPPTWRTLNDNAFETQTLFEPASTKTNNTVIQWHQRTKGTATSSSKTNAEAEPNAIDNRHRLIRRAQELIGTPYKWGGTSEVSGFDCSGLLVYLFRNEAGLELPRTTTLMIDADFPSLSRDELQPGDAVFFDHNNQGRVSHVGLYIGDNQFIHAPRAGKTIRVDSLDNSYWSNRYTSARRFESNS